MVVRTKPCTGCGRDKPLSEFHRWGGDRPGRRSQCKECTNGGNRQRYQRTRGRVNERNNQRYRESKLAAFEAYGGAVCARCGEDHLDVLTIDHIGGWGAGHRRAEGIGSGSSFYRFLKRLNYPPLPLRVLCFDCNLAEYVGEGEPVTKDERYRRKLKTDAFDAYGGPVCAHCGETRLACLTVDHIDGGGNAHRRKVGAGWQFYKQLRRDGYPPGYRILCMNCNHLKYLHGMIKQEVG